MVVSIEVVKSVCGIVRIAVTDLNEVVIPTRFLIGLTARQEVDLCHVKDCCSDCGKGQSSLSVSQGGGVSYTYVNYQQSDQRRSGVEDIRWPTTSKPCKRKRTILHGEKFG